MVFDIIEHLQIRPELKESILEFRKQYPVEPQFQSRIPVPSNIYYGTDIWEKAVTALLCGKNILLVGHKATGKNIFAENKKNGSICVIAATLVMALITGIAYANIIEDKVQVDSPEYQVKIEEAIAAKLSNPFAFSDEDRYKNDADYVPTQEEIDEIRNFDTLAAWLSDETGNYKVGNVYSISKSEAHYNLTDGFAPPQVLGNGNRSIYWKDADGGWQLKKGDTLDFRIYYDGERMRENPKQRDLLKFGYFRNGEEYYDLINIEGGEELAFRFEADKDGEYAFYMFNPSSYYIIIEAVAIEG